MQESIPAITGISDTSKARLVYYRPGITPPFAHGPADGAGYQPLDATLTALALLDGSGFDATNSILRLGVDVWPDREPGTPPNVAQGVVAVGAEILEGTDVDATFSTFFGFRTAQNANHLYGCDFVGFRTGDSVTDGQYLQLFGIDCGASLETGRNSALVGAHAANHKTEIQSSTVLGVTAGYGGGTILTSVVIGNSSADNGLSSDPVNIENSVVIGNFAARFMDITSGGTGNIVIGNNAASINDLTGGFNTFVGRSSASSITTGAQNSFFGDGANGAATSNNQTAIGFNATCTASNQVMLGNSSVTEVKTSGAVVPVTTNTRALGTASLVWSNVYATAVTTGHIAFPATQSASADPNTLDDYEEGTYTPTVTASVGTITTVSATGSYTKIGNRVFFDAQVVMTTNGTGSGSLVVGLPFTTGGIGGIAGQNVSTAVGLAGGISSGATTVAVRTAAAAYPIADGQTIRISGQYRV